MWAGRLCCAAPVGGRREPMTANPVLLPLAEEGEPVAMVLGMITLGPAAPACAALFHVDILG